MEEIDGPYRFRHPVTVRFRDIDIAGHAHHSEVLMYFEEARWAYMGHVLDRGTLDDMDYVLAEARLRWHERILWPQTVSVGVRVSQVGRKHFELDYEVRSEDGRRLASGHTVQVMYDYGAGASMLMPPATAARLREFDGLFEGPSGSAGGLAAAVDSL